MPKNKQAIIKFNMHPDTVVHGSSHNPYNKYVKNQLNIINKKKTKDEKEYYLWLFICYLKQNLRINKDKLPWC